MQNIGTPGMQPIHPKRIVYKYLHCNIIVISTVRSYQKDIVDGKKLIKINMKTHEIETEKKHVKLIHEIVNCFKILT